MGDTKKVDRMGLAAVSNDKCIVGETLQLMKDNAASTIDNATVKKYSGLIRHSCGELSAIKICRGYVVYTCNMAYDLLGYPKFGKACLISEKERRIVSETKADEMPFGVYDFIAYHDGKLIANVRDVNEGLDKESTAVDIFKIRYPWWEGLRQDFVDD